MTEHRLRNISIVLLFIITQVSEAQHIESYGIFMGMNFPFTIDQGIQKDNRYFGKFTLRATPVGFSYGYDKVGHGFVITPSLAKIGQKFIIKNTQGGEVGERDVQMDYLSIPVALKLHLNDLAFFRLSVVASAHFDYLVSGKETISHISAKLRYPSGVIIPTDPGYTTVYDGVFVPEVDKQVYVSKDKFKSFQLSAGVGFRSDFDFNENWSMNFDGRAVFGIFDPRKQDYVNVLKAGTTTNPAPDLYGQRREVYLYATIGISRIFQIKQDHRPKISSRPGGMSSPVKSKKPRNK
jgi:Outer membrane protein beta-barrel domain